MRTESVARDFETRCQSSVWDCFFAKRPPLRSNEQQNEEGEQHDDRFLLLNEVFFLLGPVPTKKIQKQTLLYHERLPYQNKSCCQVQGLPLAWNNQSAKTDKDFSPARILQRPDPCDSAAFKR